jgi:hypothetical protein
LHGKLRNLLENQNVNEEWSKIQTTINEDASDTIRKEGRKHRTEWWDEGYRSRMQEKDEAEETMLQTKTTASQELYKTKTQWSESASELYRPSDSRLSAK